MAGCSMLRQSMQPVKIQPARTNVVQVRRVFLSVERLTGVVAQTMLMMLLTPEWRAKPSACDTRPGSNPQQRT